MTGDLLTTLDDLERFFPGYMAAIEDLKAGDKLEAFVAIRTAAGVDYVAGDIFELIEPTGQAPFGTILPPHNWVVKCKHFSPPAPQSIWSNIYIGIAQGFMRKIES